MSHVMVLGYSLLSPLVIQLPVNRRGGLGSVLCWNNSLSLLPHAAVSCEHTSLCVLCAAERHLQLLPRAEHLSSLTCRGAHFYADKRNSVYWRCKGLASPSALAQKRKKI